MGFFSRTTLRLGSRIRQASIAPVTRRAADSPAPPFLETEKWALSRWLPSLVRVVGTHPFPLDELLTMAGAFEYHRPELVVDIGTHLGKSARLWYEVARWLGEPCQIHTIDLFDPKHSEFPGVQLGEFIRGLPVVQHLGDGYTVAREIFLASPGKRALLFLDGDHAYETVLRELQLATLLRPGASCILVHDTFYQPGSSYNHGPYLAIEEYRKTFSFRQVVHLQLGLPGLSYLQV
jgi:cephalosporin hydroxylase